MRSSTRYVLYSAIMVLVLGVLSLVTHDAVFSERSSPALLSFYVLGNAGLWTILFVVGLLRHGVPALWLLVVMPLAFFHVGLVLMLAFSGL